MRTRPARLVLVALSVAAGAAGAVAVSTAGAAPGALIPPFVPFGSAPSPALTDPPEPDLDLKAKRIVRRPTALGRGIPVTVTANTNGTVNVKIFGPDRKTVWGFGGIDGDVEGTNTFNVRLNATGKAKAPGHRLRRVLGAAPGGGDLTTLNGQDTEKAAFRIFYGPS